MPEKLCTARLHIGDDFGDNSATIRCQLPKGHEGLHKEAFEHSVYSKDYKSIKGINSVTITWNVDEGEE
jgi:hypothetical protein